MWHLAQGVKNAVPKTILQLMNVEGMTRENVASHLQKYRLYLKRLAGYPSGARLPLDTLQQVQQVRFLSVLCCHSDSMQKGCWTVKKSQIGFWKINRVR